MIKSADAIKTDASSFFYEASPIFADFAYGFLGKCLEDQFHNEIINWFNLRMDPTLSCPRYQMVTGVNWCPKKRGLA